MKNWQKWFSCIFGVLISIIGLNAIFTKQIITTKGGLSVGGQAQGIGVCFFILGIYLIIINIKKRKG